MKINAYVLHTCAAEDPKGKFPNRIFFYVIFFFWKPEAHVLKLFKTEDFRL
jgi:hypothetical protein